jgi:RimJ/RimL family protein N-acetyltransferase
MAMREASAAYRQAVRDTFSRLKRIARPEDLKGRKVSLEPGLGALVPVCELHASDADLIATLARWREQNTHWYPTQFRVTLAGTAAWLRAQVLDIEDRIMFLVADEAGTLVGHLGLAHAINDRFEMKVDNVMRGPREATPGIMSAALRTMLEWAGRTLGVRRFYLPVFSDNEHAIRFYRRLGFQEGNLVPLRRHEEGERVCYRPLAAGDQAAPDRHHLLMSYTAPWTASGLSREARAG